MLAVLGLALFAVYRVSASEELASNMADLSMVFMALKVVLRYLMNLSLYGDFEIPWPDINLLFFSWPKLLRFDFFELFELSCIADLNLLGVMALHWAFPVFLIVVLACAGLLNNILARVTTRWQHASWTSVLQLAGIAYSTSMTSIVKLCLLPLECVEHPTFFSLIDQENSNTTTSFTLVGMPSVECFHGEQKILTPVAYFFLVFYVAFYLALMAYVCYQVPTDGWLTTPCKFMYNDFRSAVYWWGPVQVAKEALRAFTRSIFWKAQASVLHYAWTVDLNVSLAQFLHFRQSACQSIPSANISRMADF